ncbi:class I SAM-dependent methyltransferase [Paenibacillus antri]|uniref:Class I SAM-dependent methyltransferase n=2 Tax=Paenibacillus antri TaxID=2582848 RepID=A0A5R9GH89_9BACL|nr:class I SAM-dependent methyltransferase [Paenibacillus antri]
MSGKELANPRTHKDWLPPHSLAWYAQLGKMTGQYRLPWNLTISGPNAEAIFEEEVSSMVRNKIVLDIGCGHGEFTVRWGPVVKQIVGIDITDDFIEAGKAKGFANVSFVAADSKQRLPFDDNAFDCAYNRKGPTSAYVDVRRIVKQGGRIMGLHPGDRLSPELPQLFPDLFEPLREGTPVLDKLKANLEKGGLLDQASIEIVKSASYLHEPLDIVKICCFGQRPSIYEMVVDTWMPEIEESFERHATEEGLAVTGETYLVRIRME